MKTAADAGARTLPWVEPPPQSERQFYSAPSNLFSRGWSDRVPAVCAVRWQRTRLEWTYRCTTVEIFVALLISYEVQVNYVVPGLVETRWTATCGATIRMRTQRQSG